MSGRKKIRPVFGLSLRAKIMAIIGGGALFSLVAILVLLFVSWQADKNLVRASAAQRHLELLISLSGRVSDYGLAAMEIAQAAKPAPERLVSARSRVANIFQALDNVVADQVRLVASDDARSRAATKSLSVARMKAQFEALHKYLLGLAAREEKGQEPIALARGAMDAFGINFAPLLSQALENERSDARKAREDMAALRHHVSIFSLLWFLGGIVIAVLLYLLAGRPILTRVAETVSGAQAISSGKLEQRLVPSGRDELTLLMARFNRMADKLSRRENKLLSAQKSLKRTIASRTAELRTANSRLEEIDANRRQFFADISHELRTPLTVILGEAEVSLRGADAGSDAPMRKAFQTIRGRARLLRRRVDDMLRVARSESGKLDLDFADGDLNDVIKEAVDDAAPLARRLKISLDVKHHSVALPINCDKEWLRQVVGGLVSNAIKFSVDGTRVRIATSKSKGMARILIEDQGCGIAEADLPHVFERFYRGQNRPDEGDSGYGIGLALVKWIITEHGGEVAVKSPIGGTARKRSAAKPGTAVTIELPLAG